MQFADAALLFATLSLLTGAESSSDSQSGGVVSLPFTVRYTADNGIRARDATGDAELGNSWVRYGQFLVNVSIGTPAQPITVKIDTATADSWFFGKGSCDESRVDCLGGSFDPDASSTFTTLDYPDFHIEYVSPSDTEVDGIYFSDALRIGDELTLKNVTLIEATETQALTRAIMGIGFSNDSTLAQGGQWYPTVIDEMLLQGKIGRRAYGLYMDGKDAETGEILFGGYDKAKFDGDLTALSIVPGNDDFVVDFLSVSITNGSGTLPLSASNGSRNDAPEFPTTALIDAGSSFLKLPTDAYSAFINSLGGAIDSSGYVDCDFGQSSSLNFVFGNSTVNTEIKVSLFDLAVPYMNTDGEYKEDSDGNRVCMLGVDESSKSSKHSIGDTFLRSAYVVFDLDHREVSMAQLKHDASGSEVVALGADGQITQTSATSTATSTGTAVVSSTGGASTTESTGAAQTSPNAAPTLQPVTNALGTVFIVAWLSSHI
ncbi:putative Aspartic peptidase domain-containing protein [Seiridium cardinale]|uniref:Aspartic peptidase domain-containing protein n=1 Tax=Seiridium cardinale TaxID=138064 RepID=A0ABR2Y2F6_9PEZI